MNYRLVKLIVTSITSVIGSSGLFQVLLSEITSTSTSVWHCLIILCLTLATSPIINELVVGVLFLMNKMFVFSEMLFSHGVYLHNEQHKAATYCFKTDDAL
jgi:hypothetical protein